MILRRKEMARKIAGSERKGRHATSTRTRELRARPISKTRRSEHRFNIHNEMGRNKKLETE